MGSLLEEKQFISGDSEGKSKYNSAYGKYIGGYIFL